MVLNADKLSSITESVLTTDDADVARWWNAVITLQEVADKSSATVSQTSFTLRQTPSSNRNTFL